MLDAVLARYPDLPRSVARLHQQFADADGIGSDDFFRRVEGAVRFVKGKHRGSPLAAVAGSSPEYLQWMLGQDFFDDTKAVIRDALAAARAGRVGDDEPDLSVP